MYYDNEKEWQERGIDYDLYACLYYNPRTGFGVRDIGKVLAVWEGENDGDDWRWVLQLKDGRFVFLQGGCDYTGWDCQSWATHRFADSAEQAAEFALGNVPVDESSPVDAGLGHMLNILSGTYSENFEKVYESLLEQIEKGKQQVWSEVIGIELSVEAATKAQVNAILLENLLVSLVSDSYCGLCFGDTLYSCLHCGATGLFPEEGGLIDKVSPTTLKHADECPIKKARQFLGLVVKNGKWVKE